MVQLKECYLLEDSIMLDKIFDLIPRLIAAIVMILVIGLMFVYAPLLLIKEQFFKSVDNSTYFSFSIICCLILGSVYYFYSKVKKRLTKCVHGVRGGVTYNLCKECIIEKEEKEKLEKERLRLEELKVYADEFRKEQIKKLKIKQYGKLEYLYSLNPYEFEDAVADMFRRLGYTVEQTPYSNDHGKDAIAYKNNKKYLIECKRYDKENKVGRPQLQKFFAAIYEEKAVKGFFITTGFFAETAYEYAKDNKIELINGTRLVEGMRKAYPESNDDTVQVMCLACGDIVTFNMDQGDVPRKYCKNKHIVEKNITYNDLKSTAYASKRRSRYRFITFIIK